MVVYFLSLSAATLARFPFLDAYQTSSDRPITEADWTTPPISVYFSRYLLVAFFSLQARFPLVFLCTDTSLPLFRHFPQFFFSPSKLTKLRGALIFFFSKVFEVP